MAIQGYRLGLPMWGNKAWVGSLYRRGARAGEFLAQYAAVFNAVEGNTTFYSSPRAEIVDRWARCVPEGFRFCFKFPQGITHERALDNAVDPARRFLALMAPLTGRLGPFMLQLPPSFGPARIDRLATFLEALPAEHSYAVELRHPAFSAGEAERRVNQVLSDAGCARVIVDSRALRSGPADAPAVQEALEKKPNLPVHPVITAADPIVRFVGHPDTATTEPWLHRWAERLQQWLALGRHPYFFVHVPDNDLVPPVARRFHAALADRSPQVGMMSPWPGEAGVDAQLRLL